MFELTQVDDIHNLVLQISLPIAHVAPGEISTDVWNRLGEPAFEILNTQLVLVVAVLQLVSRRLGCSDIQWKISHFVFEVQFVNGTVGI